MATKKSPEPKVTEIEEKESAAEPVQAEEKNDAMQREMKKQAAEIEQLKKQLAAAQKANPVNRTQNDAEVVRQAAEEAAASGKDPWTVEVTIRVPHRQRNEDPWYWVSINGRSAQIPADDRYQTMKLPYAEALINSLEAEQLAADYQDQIEVYDPIMNPHRD